LPIDATNAQLAGVISRAILVAATPLTRVGWAGVGAAEVGVWAGLPVLACLAADVAEPDTSICVGIGRSRGV
jgi:hypothetical protein